MRFLPCVLFAASLSATALSQTPSDGEFRPFRNVRDYGAVGDGVTDDTTAFRQALQRDRGNEGEKLPADVFVPPGTYLISDTLVLWKATHLAGDEKRRPKLILKNKAAGFGEASNPKPLLVTANGWNTPTLSTNWQLADQISKVANNTFYTSIRNLEIDLGEENSGAWGIYWKVAQQTSLRNVKITATSAAGCIRSTGDGGGGILADLDCQGGDYGWLTDHTPQFFLRSSRFTGQRVASIAMSNPTMFVFAEVTFEKTAPLMTLGGTLALVGCRFSSMSSAPAIQPVGTILWVEKTSFSKEEEIPPALKTSARNLAIDAWSTGPGWISGKTVSETPVPAEAFQNLPAPLLLPYPQIPGNVIDIKNLGAKGDGVSNDTGPILKALADHDRIFFPSGTYLVRRPLVIRPGQQIFGSAFSVILLQADSPGFGAGSKKAFVHVTGAGAQGVTLCRLVFKHNAPGGINLLWEGDKSSRVFDTQFSTYASTAEANAVFAPESGGYFENCWMPGGAKNGLFLASKQPLYLYAVQPEQYKNVAVDIRGADQLMAINLQMENTPLPIQITKTSGLRMIGSGAGNWAKTSPCLVKNLDRSNRFFLSNLLLNNNSIIVIGSDGKKSGPTGVNTGSYNGVGFYGR